MSNEISYCSWCFNKTLHKLVEENFFTRNVYHCSCCNNKTLECRFCKNMSRGGLWDDEMCMDCIGSIENFEIINEGFSGVRNTPKQGDIIGVNRYGGIFDHYGIYNNKNSIIHFTSKDSDIGDNVVIETTFNRFLRGSNNFFVIPLYKGGGGYSKTLFSPEETVKRAMSKLGKKDYSFINNNCEHFAFWCKAGLSTSSQINNIVTTYHILSLIAETITEE